jgi:hypothetical protein
MGKWWLVACGLSRICIAIYLGVAVWRAGIAKKTLRREQLPHPKSRSIMRSCHSYLNSEDTTQSLTESGAQVQDETTAKHLRITEYVNPLSRGSQAPDQSARGKPGLIGKGGTPTPVMGGIAAPIVADRQCQSILGGMLTGCWTELIRPRGVAGWAKVEERRVTE